jgi:hypothetical protein
LNKKVEPTILQMELQSSVCTKVGRDGDLFDGSHSLFGKLNFKFEAEFEHV